MGFANKSAILMTKLGPNGAVKTVTPGVTGQTNAAVLGNGHNIVSSTVTAVGIAFPTTTADDANGIISIRNGSTNTVTLYPSLVIGTGTLDGVTGSGTIATGGVAICICEGANAWVKK